MENKVDILQPEEGKVVINNMQVVIRPVDRSFKDVAALFNALETAESPYYSNRSDLYDIYETVLMDGWLTGLISKREKNVTNKKLVFKNGDKKVDALDTLISQEKFRQLRKDRFQKLSYGLVGIEVIPGKEFDYKLIPRKHIQPGRKLITKEQWGFEGSSYEGVWNIIVLGGVNEFGFLLKCSPYAIWKKGTLADWAQYIEVFGQPMIIFTYDAHDIKTKKELDEMMRNLGSGTKMSVPKQVELKMEDGKQNNGDGALQEKFRTACNEEMSVIVLGVTETTGSSKSSGYAQSETHSKQQDEVTKDDLADELSFFNSPQWLAIQKSYGYPAEGQWHHEEVVDMKEVVAKVDIALKLRKGGTPVGDDHMYQITGIPQPKDYAEQKAKQEQQAVADPQKPGPVRPGDNGKKPPKKEDMADEPKAGMWESFKAWATTFFAEARN